MNRNIVAQGCEKCLPQALAVGPRLFYDHVAERFGDGDHIEVYLGDERLTDCFEAIPRDENGFAWVWRYVQQKRVAETQNVTCRNPKCDGHKRVPCAAFVVEKHPQGAVRVKRTLVRPRLILV